MYSRNDFVWPSSSSFRKNARNVGRAAKYSTPGECELEELLRNDILLTFWILVDVCGCHFGDFREILEQKRTNNCLEENITTTHCEQIYLFIFYYTIQSVMLLNHFRCQFSYVCGKCHTLAHNNQMSTHADRMNAVIHSTRPVRIDNNINPQLELNIGLL